MTHLYIPLGYLISFDIFVVAIGIYYLYKMLKDTRAVALLKGIVFLAIINLISHLFNLYVINWILQQSMTVLLFALPVVFQPELRRALEQLGRGRIFSKAQNVNEEEMDMAINEVGWRRHALCPVNIRGTHRV